MEDAAEERRGEGGDEGGGGDEESVYGHLRIGLRRGVGEPARGTRFQLQLPLTLSVVRTLLVAVGGESYAFPLASIARAVALPQEKIRRSMELFAREVMPHFRDR